MIKISQFSVPCSVYRGGTSRGLFFLKEHLPEDDEVQKKIFLSGVDAYNLSQIDGLGSGTSHTSKAVIISRSSFDDVDVDYTFMQVGIGEEVLDDKGTCGNLMVAVGAFAVDEGLVEAAPSDHYVLVKVFNTNIQKRIEIKVPVENGKAKTNGDYFMPGVTRPGAKNIVDIISPGGGKTGRTLPLDAIFSVRTKTATYQVSFIDIVNPFVFVSSQSFGLTGKEQNSELSTNASLMEELDTIRNEVTVAAGLAQNTEQARIVSPAIPKIGLVAEPQDYMTTSGNRVKKEEIDIVARAVSMGRLHRTFPASGLYNLAAAVLLPNTIPNQLSTKKSSDKAQKVRIGHPDGVVDIRVYLTDDGHDVASVGLERTARRIIKGDLFIPS